MTEFEPVKVKFKKTSVITMTFMGMAFALLVPALHGSFDAYKLTMEFSKGFLISTGVIFLILKISPMYIFPEGIQGFKLNVFSRQPVLIPWAEIDYNRIRRYRFFFFICIQFSFWGHNRIFFPGPFHIENGEEILLLIERYTKKYREYEMR